MARRRRKAKAIRASQKPSNFYFQADASLEFEAAAAEGEERTPKRFAMRPAYSGGPLKLPEYDADVYLDLSTLEAGGRLPALRQHSHERPVGVVSASVVGGELHAEGSLVSSDDADTVARLAKDGFPWQPSIGAHPGRITRFKANQSVEVNGRTVNGPAYVAYGARLREISFTTLGADVDAVAVVASGTGDNMTIHENEEQQVHQDEVRQEEPRSSSVSSITAMAREERERQAAIADLIAAAISDGNDLDMVEALGQRAIRQSWTPQTTELELLRATRITGPFSTGQDRRRRSDRMIQASLDLAIGTSTSDLEAEYDEKTLNAMDDDVELKHGVSLVDLLMMAAQRNSGVRQISRRDVSGLLRAAFPPMIQASGGFSTLDIDGILSNTANKQIRRGFDHVEQTWRQVSAIESVRDLKQNTYYALTGDLKYELVAPTGEIRHGTLGELSYTNQAHTYAKMLSITRTDIINDDLRALSVVPRRLGRGAGLQLNLIFWTEFMADAGTFFTTGRLNYFSGAATNLSLSSLTTAEQMFMDQIDADGYPVSIMPKVLLVPPNIGTLAANIFNSTEVRPGSDSTLLTANPHAGKFTPAVSSYLNNTSITGYSTTAWYLLADPGDVPMIEVVFLNGRQTPTVESSQADFNTLGIQMRGFHDFGVNKQEYRAAVKSKGAA